VISNWTRAARSFNFEITRMISDQIALHSVQLPLFITVLTTSMIHINIIIQHHLRVKSDISEDRMGTNNNFVDTEQRFSCDCTKRRIMVSAFVKSDSWVSFYGQSSYTQLSTGLICFCLRLVKIVIWLFFGYGRLNNNLKTSRYHHSISQGYTVPIFHDSGVSGSRVRLWCAGLLEYFHSVCCLS